MENHLCKNHIWKNRFSYLVVYLQMLIKVWITEKQSVNQFFVKQKMVEMYGCSYSNEGNTGKY